MSWRICGFVVFLLFYQPVQSEPHPFKILAAIQLEEDLFNRLYSSYQGKEGAKIEMANNLLKVPRTCHPKVIERHLNSNSKFLGYTLSEKLNLCDDHLHRNGRADNFPLLAPWLEVARESNYTYRYELSSNYSAWYFADSYGRMMTGHLAIQPGFRKRPLVIFKCGLDCSVENVPIEKAMMVFFDTHPFHVLVLPSMSGPEFTEKNDVSGLPGLDEGRHLLEVARFVQSPEFPYASHIESVHVVGFSLGGLSALYSALYHDTAVVYGAKPIVDSFLAICPVVDLESATSQLLKSTVADYYFGHDVGKFFRFKHGQAPPQELFSSELIQQTYGWSDEQIHSTIGDAGKGLFQTLLAQSPWNTKPFQGIKFRDASQFWWFHNFSNFVHRIKSPLLIWGAKDDPLVPYSKNVGRIRELVSSDFPNIKVIGTKRGSHCAYSQNFGFNLPTEIMGRFIIQNSIQFKTLERNVRIPLPQKYIEWMKNYGGIVHRFWSVDAMADRAHLHVTPVRCFSSRDCNMSFEFPLETFPFFSEPMNSAEAQGITRWLNANVRLLNGAGKIIRMGDFPVSFTFKAY